MKYLPRHSELKRQDAVNTTRRVRGSDVPGLKRRVGRSGPRTCNEVVGAYPATSQNPVAGVFSRRGR